LRYDAGNYELNITSATCLLKNGIKSKTESEKINERLYDAEYHAQTGTPVFFYLPEP
jgi:hypothetical protein